LHVEEGFSEVVQTGGEVDERQGGQSGEGRVWETRRAKKVDYLVAVGALDDEFGQGGSFEKIN
jgi:hypothetical protein